MQQTWGWVRALAGVVCLCLAPLCASESGSPIDDQGRLRPVRQDGSGGARAQIPIAEGPQVNFLRPLQARSGREAPVYEEPDGVRKDRWLFHPKYTLQTIYDDNVLGRPDATKQDDVIVQHTPGFDFTYRPRETLVFQGNYQLGWNNYMDDMQRDYLSHDLNLAATWRDVYHRGLSVGIHESYSQTGNTQVLEDEFQSFTRVQGNNLGLEVGYEKGRMEFSAGYEFGVVDYMARRDSDGSYYRHTVPLTFSYKLARNLVPYLTYDYNANRFHVDQDRNFDTHQIMVGVKAILYRKFAFDAAVGNSRAIAINPYDSNDGPAARLNLIYTHSERIQAYFKAAHSFYSGIRTGSGIVNEAELGGYFRINRRFNISLASLWRAEDRDTGTEQTTLTLQSSFNYRIKKCFEASVGYNRSERQSSQARDVTINQGTISLRFRW